MKSKTDKKWMILTYAAIVVFTIVFICSVYPAEIPDDTASILNDIFHHDRWRDWHPVTYYIFIKLAMSLIKTPHMVVLAQSVMFLAAQYQIVRYIDLYCGRYVFIIYLFFLIIIGFAGYEYLIILQKDSPYSFAYLGVTISLLYCVKEEAKIRHLLSLGIWCMLAAAMRHMGGLSIVVGTGILVICLMKRCKKGWPIKIMIAMLAGIMITSSVRQIMIKEYNLDTPPKYITYTMPLYMLGAYSVGDFELDNSVIEVMEEVMPLSKWRECYEADIYFADNLSRETAINEGYVNNVDSKDLYNEIIYANVLYFVHHPTDYIYKLFRMNSLVWSFITPANGYIECMPTGGSGGELAKQFPEWIPRKSLSSNLLYGIINYIKTSPLKSFFYRGGVAFWMIFGTMAYQIKKKKHEYAMVLAPISALNIMMMLSIPAQDIRYVLPEIVVAGICPLLVFDNSKKKKNR